MGINVTPTSIIVVVSDNF